MLARRLQRSALSMMAAVLGLWPSDHAGLSASLLVRNPRLAARAP